MREPERKLWQGGTWTRTTLWMSSSISASSRDRLLNFILKKLLIHILQLLSAVPGDMGDEGGAGDNGEEE